MCLGVALLGGGESARERGLAAGHLRPVALVDRLERVELGHEPTHRAQLGELAGEHAVDARRAGLPAQGTDALSQEAGVVRLALRDDEVACPQQRIVLVLGPGGVEDGAPALERTEHVEAFEDLVAMTRGHGTPHSDPRAALGSTTFPRSARRLQGRRMAVRRRSLAFDFAEGTRYLRTRDAVLARVIAEVPTTLQLQLRGALSPYEAVLEAIAYQSISRKAAATIFSRVKALGEKSRPPSPQRMLALRTP